MKGEKSSGPADRGSRGVESVHSAELIQRFIELADGLVNDSCNEVKVESYDPGHFLFTSFSQQ